MVVDFEVAVAVVDFLGREDSAVAVEVLEVEEVREAGKVEKDSKCKISLD